MDRSRKIIRRDDRISALPVELLHLILSNLPTRSQIQTTVLSRRWIQLWSTNPVLHLFQDGSGHDEYYDRPKLLIRLYRHVLDRYQIQNLLEFEADFRGLGDEVLAEKLIDFATSRSLQRFSIIVPQAYKPKPIGRPLADYMQRTLKSLRVLELKSVILPECSGLLSGCPLLERLRLVRIHGLERLTIDNPNLKIVEVESGLECSLKSLVIVEAPRLVKLMSIVIVENSWNPPANLTVSIENKVPHLFGVSLVRDLWESPSYLLPVIPSIWHLRVLCIDLYLLKEIVDRYIIRRSQPNLFGNLMELHLNGNWVSDPLLEALRDFLARGPPVAKLCLLFGDESRSPDMSDDLYNGSSMEYHEYIGLIHENEKGKPSYRPLEICTAMTRLTSTTMIGFMGTRNEIRLVYFLLRSATNLESLLLFYGGCDCPKNLIEQLSSCDRASSSARVMLAGEKDEIKAICRQAPTTSLFDYVVEELRQSVCICPWHSVEQHPQYGKMKSVYVNRPKRMKGTVKWFSSTKGFGFICPDDGSKDIFVHQSAIMSHGYPSLTEGEAIDFQIASDNDGRTQAVNVTGPHGVYISGDRECCGRGRSNYESRDSGRRGDFHRGDIGHRDGGRSYDRGSGNTHDRPYRYGESRNMVRDYGSEGGSSGRKYSNGNCR